MQVTETNSDGLKREFTITVPRADIVQKLENQLESLKSRIRLPGFRPGKAPLPLLKKLHGKSLMGQVLEETINETSGKTLEERNLRPALQPQIEITKFDLEAESDLEYKMSVEIVPEIKVPDFSEIKLERLVADVPDELVDQEIERLAASRKNFVAAPDGKAAENGDVVVIDFVGKLDGEPFEGGAAEGHSLELGSGSFIPGFEEQLVGVKAGEERVITV
ncbi:MAG TPA: trigger factor, partial [Sphingomonadales bacterium]